MGGEECRLCCAPLALISLTCGKSRKKRDYIRKLTEITTGIKFQKNDAFRYICVFCISTIYNFHVFKMKSLQNEELLQSRIQSPLKSTKKMKVDIPDLCDIELPSIENLKTELFDWLRFKLDIGESEPEVNRITQNDIEKHGNARFSAISTQTNIPSLLMIDKQTQIETPHTYNVSCQYSIKTSDEKIQCVIRPVYIDKTSQTMKVTSKLVHDMKEFATQCNLNEKVSVDIGIQYKPICKEVPSQCDIITKESQGPKGSAVLEIDESNLIVNSEDILSVRSKSIDVDKKNGFEEKRSNTESETISTQISRRRISGKNKDISPSKTSQINGIVSIKALPSIKNNQNLSTTNEAEVVHENMEKSLESPRNCPILNKNHCDKTELNHSKIQSRESHQAGNNLESVVKRNTKKRRIDSSCDAPSGSKKQNWDEVPNANRTLQGGKKRRLNKRRNMPLPLSPIKTELLEIEQNPVDIVESEGIENGHPEIKFESLDTELQSSELSTAALLYEIDSFLSPNSMKEEDDSSLPSTPTKQNVRQRHNKTLSPSFKYDTPRSSKFLKVKDKVQYVKICRECDQPLYSENEKAKHRKFHMRCHLCQKVFTSVKKTKLHVSMECDMKLSKSVPFVYLDRVDLLPYNLCNFSGDMSSALMPSSNNCTDSPKKQSELSAMK